MYYSYNKNNLQLNLPTCVLCFSCLLSFGSKATPFVGSTHISLELQTYWLFRVLCHHRNKDIESILQRHHQIHEQLAEDMVIIAKLLRTRSLAAREIIRKDKEVQ